MLPAGSRLRRGADFAATMRRARGTRAGGLVVVHVDDVAGPGVAGPGVAGPGVAGPGVAGPGVAGQDVAPAPPRVGLVVSRAVGPAVTRNLVKRRLRHVLAARLAELPAGARVVVRALPASAVATSAQLDAAVSRALAPRKRS